MPLPWLMLGLLTVTAPSVEVRTVDNRTLVGEWVELSSEQFALKTSDSESAKLPLKDILSIQFNPKPERIETTPGLTMELLDGSRLTGQNYSVTKKAGRLTLNEKDSLEVPPRAIRYIRFGASEPKADALWAEALRSKPTNDLLVVRKKDTLDFMEGTVGNLLEDKVDFELDKEPLEVKRARVDGIIYAVSKRDLPDANCLIEDAQGWRLQAKSATSSEGQCKITTVSGVAVTRPINALVKLDFSSGKIRYLSDLEWDSAVQTPFISFGVASQTAFNQPRKDRAFESEKLRLGGKTYAKGLCLKSRTVLVYRLPSGMRSFQAISGIDDSMHGAGHVQLTISADDKIIFNEAISGKDRPRELDLNIAGAARLKILVDYGEDQDVGDHLDLCEARIQK